MALALSTAGECNLPALPGLSKGLRWLHCSFALWAMAGRSRPGSRQHSDGPRAIGQTGGGASRLIGLARHTEMETVAVGGLPPLSGLCNPLLICTRKLDAGNPGRGRGCPWLGQRRRAGRRRGPDQRLPTLRRCCAQAHTTPQATWRVTFYHHLAPRPTGPPFPIRILSLRPRKLYARYSL
jgi:hypothetical protein